jgi:hypothetical protein
MSMVTAAAVVALPAVLAKLARARKRRNAA